MSHTPRPAHDTAAEARTGLGLRWFAVLLTLVYLLVAGATAAAGSAPREPAPAAAPAATATPAATTP